jgi:hypothetical protein
LAETECGKSMIELFSADYPDLTWKSTFSRFEFQSYVRKRLTKGTRLNGDFVGEKGLAYTTRELMAYAFLVAKRRAESVEGIVKNVKDLFWPQVTIPAWVELEIRDILEEEERAFDNDFRLVKYDEHSDPIFYLPSGHENKILKRWSDTEKYTYYKMPAYESKMGEASP